MFGSRKKEKKADSASAKKWRSREAKAKTRGQPVDVEEAAGHAKLDMIAKNVQHAAMSKIVQRLPASKRRDWPKGNAHHEVSGSTISFHIEIENTKGRVIKARVAVPLGTVMEDRVRQRAVGEQLADSITHDVLQYYRYEGTDGERRLPGYTPTPKDVPRDAYEEMVAVEDETRSNPVLKERPKKVGKLGPFCIICGPEDRDTFPAWGGCPHGASDDTG